MHLKVGGKLFAILGVIMMTTIVASSLMLAQVRRLAEVEAVNTDSDIAIGYLNQMRFDVETANGALRDYVIGMDPADRTKAAYYLAEFERDHTRTHRLLHKRAPELVTPFDAYVASARVFNRDVTLAFLRQAVAGRREQVAGLIARNAGDTEKRAMDRRYAMFETLATTWADWCNRQSGEIIAVMLEIVAWASLVLIASCFVTASVVGRTVSRPLRIMTRCMTRLAEGEQDLTIPAQRRRDEIGDMARALEHFRATAIERAALRDEAARTARAIERERLQRQREMEAHAAEQGAVMAILAEALRRLAEGDLGQALTAPFPTAYELLRADFNMAVSALAEAVRLVGDCAASIQAEAHTISDHIGTESRDAERRAQQVRTTAENLNQVTQGVTHTADQIAQSQATLALARADALVANQVMERAMATMTDIESASEQIGASTSLIDTIAKRTKMLAVNATIEAAQAGVHGRGFAIVAQEVRSLANQSAEATRRIETLVHLSRDDVKAGARLVTDTGAALSRIVDQVIAINELALDIAGSAHQQSSTLSEVSMTLSDIDLGGRRHAQSSLHTASFARTLSAQAQDLVSHVARFRLAATAEQTTSTDQPAGHETAPVRGRFALHAIA